MNKKRSAQPYYFETGVWSPLLYEGPPAVRYAVWTMGTSSFDSRGDTPRKIDDALELLSFLAHPKRRLRLIRTFSEILVTKTAAPIVVNPTSFLEVREYERCRSSIWPQEGLPRELKQNTHLIAPLDWYAFPESWLKDAATFRFHKRGHWPKRLSYGVTIPAKLEYEEFFGEKFP